MKNPRVSVIIPTFNGSQWLSKTIESVIAQSFKDFEIIIIDDGSTEPIKNNLPTDHRLQYIWQENAGTSAARNRAISISRGDYVAFLDHDDLWRSDKLQNQVDLLDKYPHIGFIFCDYISLCTDTPGQNGFSRGILSKLSVIEPEAGIFFINEKQLFDLLLDDLFVQIPSTWMIRRKLLVDSDGFDPLLRRGAEDIYLALTLSTKCNLAFHRAPMATRREFQQSLSARNKWQDEFLLALNIIHKKQKLLKIENNKLFKKRKEFAENLARDDIANKDYTKAIEKLIISLEGNPPLNKKTIANYFLLAKALLKQFTKYYSK